jgi:hypothetical protein
MERKREMLGVGKKEKNKSERLDGKGSQRRTK